MSAIYRLRYWDEDELRGLDLEELQAAITGFYGPQDRETWQTVADFSRLVDEQQRRARQSRGWYEEEDR